MTAGTTQPGRSEDLRAQAAMHTADVPHAEAGKLSVDGIA